MLVLGLRRAHAIQWGPSMRIFIVPWIRLLRVALSREWETNCAGWNRSSMQASGRPIWCAQCSWDRILWLRSLTARSPLATLICYKPITNKKLCLYKGTDGGRQPTWWRERRCRINASNDSEVHVRRKIAHITAFHDEDWREAGLLRQNNWR